MLHARWLVRLERWNGDGAWVSAHGDILKYVLPGDYMFMYARGKASKWRIFLWYVPRTLTPLSTPYRSSTFAASGGIWIRASSPGEEMRVGLARDFLQDRNLIKYV